MTQEFRTGLHWLILFQGSYAVVVRWQLELEQCGAGEDGDWPCIASMRFPCTGLFRFPQGMFVSEQLGYFHGDAGLHCQCSRSDARWKQHYLADLASEVIQHHFCHTLLVINQSLIHLHSVGEILDSTSCWRSGKILDEHVALSIKYSLPLAQLFTFLPQAKCIHLSPIFFKSFIPFSTSLRLEVHHLISPGAVESPKARCLKQSTRVPVLLAEVL